MSNVEQIPPTELDLHAFLDDELEPDQRVRIIQWLMDHPDTAKELLDIQLREDLLRTAIRQSVNGTVPEELQRQIHAPTKPPVNSGMENKFIFGFILGVASAIALMGLIWIGVILIG